MYPKKVYMSLNCYLDNNKENKKQKNKKKIKKTQKRNDYTFG